MEYIHGGDIYRNRGVRLDFSVNVNPLGMPEAARAAAADSIAGCGSYPDSRCAGLKARAAALYRVGEEQIVFGNGAADLIFRLVFAVRPERVLLLAPSFAEYEAAARAAGAECEFFYLKEESGFEPDADEVLRWLAETGQKAGEEKAGERKNFRRMLFLCNPANPVGNVLPKAKLERILDFCEEQAIFTVADECFLEFLEDWESLTVLDRVRSGSRRLAVLNAATKTFAMAGLRLGYCFLADPELRNRLEAAAQPWSVSIPAQAAGEVVLGRAAPEAETGAKPEIEAKPGGARLAQHFDRDAYLRETRARIARERRYVKEALSRLGFAVYGSEANFLFFRDRSGKPEGALFDFLLARGILIRSCGNFRGLNGHFYRICVRMREENEILLTNLKQYLP